MLIVFFLILVGFFLLANDCEDFDKKVREQQKNGTLKPFEFNRPLDHNPKQ